MSFDAQHDPTAMTLAEEILQLIYGDDLKGCTVRIDDIAGIIEKGLKGRPAEELVGLYEKVVEAVHLLSTAPDSTKIDDPKRLQSLLSERLDAIHVVTTKTVETTTRLKSGRDKPS